MKVYFTQQYEGDMSYQIHFSRVLDDCGHEAQEVELTDKEIREYENAVKAMEKIQQKISRRIREQK